MRVHLLLLSWIVYAFISLDVFAQNKSVQQSFFGIMLGETRSKVELTMSAKKYNLIKQVSNNTVSYYANVYFAGNKWDVIFNYMKDGRLYCVSFIHTETTPENRKAFNQVLLDRLVNKYGLPSCYEDDKDWIFEWSDSITEVSVSYSNTIFSYYTMLSYRDIQLFNSKHACDELEL